MNVKVKLLSPEAKAPVKSHIDDAGWDLFSAKEATVGPGETRVIPTGISMEIPHGWYGQIKSRSGLGSKGLIVTAGVVDSGYRGEVGVVVINSKTDGEFIFKAGDKIAQMVLLPVPEVSFEVTDELNNTKRGEKGFGSTGVN
ncbi:MAG: dUTP diphosphatase [Deltaproteobacteria bacterium]|nr:dUTP diphosphatase [Deltaproteobacteria bacterium]